jgi:hypothetical protein
MKGGDIVIVYLSNHTYESNVGRIIRHLHQSESDAMDCLTAKRRWPESEQKIHEAWINEYQVDILLAECESDKDRQVWMEEIAFRFDPGDVWDDLNLGYTKTDIDDYWTINHQPTIDGDYVPIDDSTAGDWYAIVAEALGYPVGTSDKAVV